MSRRHPQHTSRAPTRAVHLLPAARQPLAPAPLGSRAAVPKSAAALRPEGRQERRVLPAPADGIWLPIELWTHIFSYLEDWMDLYNCQLVCRAFYLAAQSPGAWRRVIAPVRNPLWVAVGEPRLEFLLPSVRPQAFGVYYISPRGRQLMAKRNIRRIALLGPNICTSTSHFHALACECPDVTHLTLYRLPLLTASMAEIGMRCQRLKNVRLIEMSLKANLAAMTHLQSVETLTLQDCTEVPPIEDMVQTLTQLPQLRRLEVAGSDSSAIVGQLQGLTEIELRVVPRYDRDWQRSKALHVSSAAVRQERDDLRDFDFPQLDASKRRPELQTAREPRLRWADLVYERPMG